MLNSLNIVYNNIDDILTISKMHKRNITKKVEGKYGIKVCYNIEGDIISISIPEPSYFFGVDIDDLKKFVMER